LIRPDGEPWTLETFTAGVETTGVWSIVHRSDIPTDSRFEPEYYQPKYIRLEKTLSEMNCDSLDDLAVTINSGPFGSNLLKTTYVDDGVIVLRPFNIANVTVGDGELVYISLADLETQGLSLYEPRNVAFARVGDIRCGIIPDFGKPITISPNIIIARLDEQAVNPYYVAAFMNTKLGFSQLQRALKVVAQPTITVETVKSLLIPKLSIYQQSEIENLVQASFQKRAKSQILYAEAETLLLAELGLDTAQTSEVWQTSEVSYTQKAGQVWAAGRLDAEYFQPKYYQSLDAIASKMEMRGWSMMCLGQISGPLKYGTSTKLEYLQEGVPFLRIADVNEWRFSLDTIRYISEEQAKQEQQARVQTSDVLISRSGTLGLTVVIPEYLNEAIFGSYFIRVRLHSKQIIPEYLALFINSPIGQAWVERLNTGAIQTNLTIPAIESIPIPIPPLDVQKMMTQKVLASFAAEDEAKRLLEQAKRRVEEMVLEA